MPSPQADGHPFRFALHRQHGLVDGNLPIAVVVGASAGLQGLAREQDGHHRNDFVDRNDTVAVTIARARRTCRHRPGDSENGYDPADSRSHPHHMKSITPPAARRQGESQPPRNDGRDSYFISLWICLKRGSSALRTHSRSTISVDEGTAPEPVILLQATS